MAKRGDTAKATATDIIAKAFGDNLVAIADKKIYINVDDGNGEMVQLAIAMTMPKTAVGVVAQPLSWSATPPAEGSKVVAPSGAGISPEDEAEVQRLMKDLGII